MLAVPAVLLLSMLAPPASAPGGVAVHPAVEEALRLAAPDDVLAVVVRMRGQADLSGAASLAPGPRRAAVVTALRAASDSSQAGLRSFLAGRGPGVARFTPLWIVDGISLAATAPVIREIASRGDVAAITPDAIDVVP